MRTLELHEALRRAIGSITRVQDLVCQQRGPCTCSNRTTLWQWLQRQILGRQT